ncbi:helical backbone metal receptor [Spirosoma radiotolerans]|uniref:Iron ABC transporter n=1 Tax=Spirosoma radiotolerans TaxID=1379870 RepID=A0A0E3ZUY0_9BACT|nr:helical backbone metal receptor [Spirosoma radiotolerans]AKD54708.1 iron ABC transporter [Spirosoma radiotolerans]
MHPNRIISLVPSQTELLFDLGLDQAIVGITKFCVHPAERVKQKALIGGTKTLNLDRIRELDPDLIIANKEENTRDQIEELQRQYPVHVTDMTTLPDALRMIREVGTLVARATEADQLAKRIELSLLPPFPPLGLSVAYLIWRKPYMAAASSTFIQAMLEVAGFSNAFADQTRYPEITPADLQKAQPHLIFLSSEPYPFTEKHIEELQQICPSAQVLLVDGEVFSWYGSRLLQASDYFRNLRSQITRQTV